MRNKLYYYLQVFIALVYLTFSTGLPVVFAEDTVHPDELKKEISNTANEAVCASAENKSDSTAVTNTNATQASQTTNATANTGNNTANRNISIGGNAGMISTGNATVNTTTGAQTNTNGTQVSTPTASPTTASQTTNTGDNLTTTTQKDSNTSTFVNNKNTAQITQNTNASANTGNNTADRNISVGGQAGVISTGTASTNTNSLVTSGGNVTLVGGESNGNGPGSGASISVSNTGSGTGLLNSTSQNNTSTVNNQNNAVISQLCGGALGCSSNTGNNTSNRGIATGGGSAGVINTGNALTNVAFGIFANSNQQSQSTDKANLNNVNISSSNQVAYATANTGNNTADRNISIGGNAGVITTGNATVNVTMIANGNTNASTASPSTNQNTPSSSGATFLGDLLNTGNHGAFYSNTDIFHDVVINNLNYSQTNQLLIVSANTGSNSSNNNSSNGESAGAITTGNAVVGAGFASYSNRNETNLVSPTPTPAPTAVSTSTFLPQSLNTTNTTITNYYYPILRLPQTTSSSNASSVNSIDPQTTYAGQKPRVLGYSSLDPVSSGETTSSAPKVLSTHMGTSTDLSTFSMLFYSSLAMIIGYYSRELKRGASSLISQLHYKFKN
ncbi:hypothetical protein HGA88_05960 [Candidatus Roizmanbacteria bacterium]|nr:hypothetical protein [Candidatus Roizmanbacteria bacterium]